MTYQVVVRSFGSCSGDSAQYSIAVDAETDPALTLLQDDTSYYENYKQHNYTLSVTGSGTIASEGKSP